MPQLSLVQGGERMSLTDSRDVDRGDSFLLYCNVTLDVGPVSMITWEKNGVIVVPKFSDKTGTDSEGNRYVYSVLNVTDPEQEEDGGDYVCTVRNHMGQENNASVEIRITGKSTSRYYFMASLVHLR